MQSPAGREQPLLAAGSVSHLPISGKPFTMHHHGFDDDHDDFDTKEDEE